MVRHNMITFAAMLAATFVLSCTKAEQFDVQQQETVITAGLEQTKTTLDGINVVWADHEDISVLSAQANDRMRLSSGAGTTSAQFRGILSEADGYVCMYPYNENASVAEGVLSFSIPQTQVLAAGSFWNDCNIAVGTMTAASASTTFHNVCGAIELQLKGSGAISKIVIKDKSGMKLWGDARLEVNGAGTDAQKLTLEGGSDEIVLDCAQGFTLTSTATTFVAIVPAGAFAQGFTATVHAMDGSTVDISSDKDNTIHRSLRRVMPVKTVNFPECFSIVNPMASAFLSQVTYDGTDYEYSYIRKFSNQSTSYRKDYPNLLTLSWSTITGASAINIYLADNAAFENAKVYHPLTVYTTKYELTNFRPGATYYYKVESVDRNGATKPVTSGSIHTHGTLRMIKASGCFNIRDFGGWPSTLTHADGTPKHTCYGKIFRGSNVDGISAEDATFMREELGIKRELDLRTDYASDANHKSTFGEGVEYVCIGVDNIFYTDLGGSNHKHYINMFNCVMESVLAGEPIYFHCAVGADRTGTLAFLVDGVLGFTENDLCKDYELTSFSAAGTRVRTDEIYKFASMMAIMKSMRGATMQQKVYNYLVDRGVDSSKLDTFIDTMLE